MEKDVGCIKSPGVGKDSPTNLRYHPEPHKAPNV